MPKFTCIFPAIINNGLVRKGTTIEVSEDQLQLPIYQPLKNTLSFKRHDSTPSTPSTPSTQDNDLLLQDLINICKGLKITIPRKPNIEQLKQLISDATKPTDIE